MEEAVAGKNRLKFGLKVQEKSVNLNKKFKCPVKSTS